METNSYLYVHIRPDTQTVFYVGIGSTVNYKRAYSHSGRSNHWRNIVKKYGYSVSIIKENLTWDEACILESEFIAKYGRLDMNEGFLVNLTNGGEGPSGVIRSKETIDKLKKVSRGKFTKDWFISKYGDDVGLDLYETRCKEISTKIIEKGGPWHKGKKLPQWSGENYPNPNRRKWALGKKLGPRSEDVKTKIRKVLGNVVLQYNMNGDFIKKWDSIRLASSSLNIRHDQISGCCKNRYGCKTAGGYIWKYEDDASDVIPIKCNPNSVSVMQYDMVGNFIKNWNSHTEAALNLGISRSAISMCCVGRRKSAGGFVWKTDR